MKSRATVEGKLMVEDMREQERFLIEEYRATSMRRHQNNAATRDKVSE